MSHSDLPRRAPGEKTRVFFTGGGGAGTIEVLKSLRATGRYELITADASPHAGGYAFADHAYVVPFGADDAFSDAFARIVAKHDPDFVVPLVDEEIPKVHRLAAEPNWRARVVTPTAKFCETTLDKWTTFQALRAADLPVAASWLAHAAAEATYPAIIKPCQGRGSRGLAFLEGPDDLRRYLESAAQPADRYIVQERLSGTEYTTSVVVALGGPCLAVVPKEATDKRGITQVGITRNVPEIDELGRRIQERLRADGPFNVQLIMGEDRIPKVIEINPRYSTTVALTLGAGLDEVDVVLRAALGEEVGPLSWAPETMMVRYTAQVYLPASQWKFGKP